MKTKFEIYNSERGYWEYVEYDEPVEYLESCKIEEIPENHVAYGWLESVFQSDYVPMFEPKFFTMTLVEIS